MADVLCVFFLLQITPVLKAIVLTHCNVKHRYCLWVFQNKSLGWVAVFRVFFFVKCTCFKLTYCLVKHLGIVYGSVKITKSDLVTMFDSLYTFKYDEKCICGSNIRTMFTQG